MSVERLTLVGGVLGLAATASGTVTRTVAASSAVVGVLCGLAAILFAIGAWRERRVVARFVEAGLTIDHRRTTERSVVASCAPELRAHRSRRKRDRKLSSVARWEATSWFNMSAAIALEHGAYAVREAHLGRCGTTSRVSSQRALARRHPSTEAAHLTGHGAVRRAYDRGVLRRRSLACDLAGRRRLRVEARRRRSCDRCRDRSVSKRSSTRSRRCVPPSPIALTFLHRVRWSKLAPRTAAAVRTVVGSDRFTSMSTPRLYDRPRALMAIVTASAALFLRSAEPPALRRLGYLTMHRGSLSHAKPDPPVKPFLVGLRNRLLQAVAQFAPGSRSVSCVAASSARWCVWEADVFYRHGGDHRGRPGRPGCGSAIGFL